MALLVAKVPFWVFPRKGVLLSVIPKSCVLLKTLFFSVFSKTQLCRHERMYLDKKIYKNRGWFARMQKGVFFRHFFGFGGFVFFFSVFLCFCFVPNSPKWLFSCIFRGFLSILFPQKACLKVFLFFLFCFFAFVFLFKNPFLYFLFVHQPLFYKRLFVGFLFFFFCLSFPFLSFACLFDTNFPNIPFLKSNLLSFLAVTFFFSCSCFCFHCVCFSLSIFSCYVGFVLCVFVLFCFVFLFLFFSCFVFSL